jgi:putative membrane protein
MRLGAEDRKQIHGAIAAAEAKTTAHLAVTIVPASDRYALYPLLWAAMIAFLAGCALAFARPDLSLRLGFVVEAAAFAVAALLFEPFASRLFVVPRAVKRDKARALAHREFAARILGAHRDGILVFASMGERHVELIATRAVHEAVGEAAWADIAARFAAAAAQGRIVEAALGAVADCGGHLARHFPR